MHKKIGIIGDGRFGTYIGQMLKNHHFDIMTSGDEVGNIAVCRQCEVILVCVPISAFSGLIDQLNTEAKLYNVFVDTLSVKMYPQKVVKQQYKGRGSFIYTHPMFGPQSAPGDCTGQRLVVCGKTNSVFDKIFFDSLGLSRIDATAEEHDREVAKSQVLNHFIGRAADHMGMQRSKFATATHDKFMEIVDIVNGNSEELFMNMNKYNFFAKQAREEFMAALDYLNFRIEE